MKKLTLILMLFSLTVSAQKINPSYQNVFDNKKVFTLVGNVLFIHKKEALSTKEQVKQLRYLRWKGKTYRYSYSHYDYGYFWCNSKKAIEIY